MTGAGTSSNASAGDRALVLRNFYIDATVDGRKGHVKFGPVGKHGSFRMKIYQLSMGCSVHVATLEGATEYNHPDALVLTVRSEHELAQGHLIVRTGR